MRLADASEIRIRPCRFGWQWELTLKDEPDDIGVTDGNHFAFSRALAIRAARRQLARDTADQPWELVSE